MTLFKKKKKEMCIHLTCRKKKAFLLFEQQAMKKRLRQDAEHRNPKVDLGDRCSALVSVGFYQFHQCLSRRLVFFPPLGGFLSQASFLGHEIPRCHLHTP